MKKILVLAACMVFALAGVAEAIPFELGGAYSYPIYSIVDGNKQAEGGGSIDISKLDGSPLSYVYCVDIFTNISPGSYPNTVVNNAGFIYGAPLNNAGQVAWLLGHYGTAGQTDAAMALQAAIWHVIFPTRYQLDTSQAPSAQITAYNNYLSALGNQTGDVSDFLWITPGLDSNANSVRYQGLVGRTPVPEPMTMLLLGLGLVGLGAVSRKRS